MANERVLITGATGMVGSLLARRALEAGYRVRGLVRSADKAAAEFPGLDVEFAEGDLAEPASVNPALADVDIVVHTAAHVGDWGHADQFRAINVFALEDMLTEVQRLGQLKRWVQVSSLGVYAARHHHGTDETEEPDVEGLDGYTRTKAEADLVLRRYMREHQFPATIVRPGFMYGPGDRHVIPAMVERINNGQMKIVGDGKKQLNNTYVGDFVDGILLAMEKEAAIGEIFNMRDERLVTREEFIHTVCDYLGAPHPKHVPEWLARLAVRPIERIARLRGATKAPILTRARIKFMTLNLDFSIDKAKRLLGYAPKVDFQDGSREALDWATKDQAGAKQSAAV